LRSQLVTSSLTSQIAISEQKKGVSSQEQMIEGRGNLAMVTHREGTANSGKPS